MILQSVKNVMTLFPGTFLIASIDWPPTYQGQEKSTLGHIRDMSPSGRFYPEGDIARFAGDELDTKTGLPGSVAADNMWWAHLVQQGRKNGYIVYKEDDGQITIDPMIMEQDALESGTGDDTAEDDPDLEDGDSEPEISERDNAEDMVNGHPVETNNMQEEDTK